MGQGERNDRDWIRREGKAIFICVYVEHIVNIGKDENETKPPKIEETRTSYSDFSCSARALSRAACSR